MKIFNFGFGKKALKISKTGSKKIAVEPLTESEKRVEEELRKGIVTLKDFLAPTEVNITPHFIQVGEKYAATMFVLVYPRYLNSGWLVPIINFDKEFNLALFIYPMNAQDVLKNLTKQTTRIEAQINEFEEKGYVRDPQLEIALRDIETLRDRLQEGVEKVFQFGCYITVFGDTEKEVKDNFEALKNFLESYLIYAKPALFLEQQGFNSTLATASDELLLTTTMNTSPLSTSFPFISSDLIQENGVLYGINVHNMSLVIFDRFTMENANMVVFGKSGGGKSYFVKLDILRAMMLNAEVIVIDPEDEYEHLAQTIDGQMVRISLATPFHINAFDIPPQIKGEDYRAVFQSHMIELLGFFKLIFGGMTAEEESIIDRAIRETYQVKGFNIDSIDEVKNLTPPKLEDFYEILSGIKGSESLVLKLEKFTKGIYSSFLNNYTNVELNKRFVVFNIRDLEEELKPIAMYLVLNFIWRRVRSNIRRRLLVVDEAWILMKTEDGASFMYSVAKRARKYYLGLTTITQDVEDFLTSRFGKAIVTNSSIQFLLKQSPAEIDLVKEVFKLTEEEKFFLLETGVGEGLFIAGLKHIALRVLASYSEDQMITTDPRQLLQIEKAKEELAKEDKFQILNN